jgi:hypothetical protein
MRANPMPYQLQNQVAAQWPRSDNALGSHREKCIILP